MAPVDPEITLDEMEAKVRERLAVLESCLPHQIDPIAISRTKLPSKVLWCREALIWRIAELARAAVQSYDAGKFGAAIVLTRAAVECSAAVWYLDEEVDTALTRGETSDLNDCADKLLWGNFGWDDFPDPVHVRKLMLSVDRSLPGFRDQYHALSEYAHPNAAGAASLFSTLDGEKILISFGRDDIRLGAARLACMANLGPALVLFELAYNKLSDRMTALITLCESLIPLLGPD